MLHIAAYVFEGGQGGKLMKSATEHLESSHREHTPRDNHTDGGSSRIHYILVAILFVLAYLVSNWSASAPGSVSVDFMSDLLFFWLAGGLITLGLLAFAAKH
jgi:hypothetical protein